MLSTQYPYYGPLFKGNYNVSLAYFGPTSQISKSIGLTSTTGLALPNIDFLERFALGDIGISDSFIKEMLAKNINDPISQKDPEVLKQFIKLNKIDIDLEKYKIGNRINVPTSAIKVPDGMEMTGFKAFEKTALQSIFETQKPFIEIVKLAIGAAAKSEDVIARVMPLLGNIKTKSRKPIGNSGNANRPRAIGYRKAEELKKKFSELSSIEAMTKLKGIKELTKKVENNKKDINYGLDVNSYWKTISISYSTGKFNPNIDYLYSYIDLPADDKKNIIDTDFEMEQENEYDKYKPKVLIFGIYDSKGSVLDPNEFLKSKSSINVNSIITETIVDTTFKRASWIFDSPKWKLPQGMYEWPTFNSATYIWEKKIFNKTTIKSSKKSPGSGYSIKKYGKNEKNLLTGEIAVQGSEMIESFDKNEKESYTNYYNDLIRLGMIDSDLTDEEKQQAFIDVNEILDINPQLEAIYSYSHTKSSFYKKVGGKKAFPDGLKKSYKPFEIYIPEAKLDKKLNKIALEANKKPGYVWIDPEADYDLKVIRIDPRKTYAYNSSSMINNESLLLIPNITNDLLTNEKVFIDEPDFYGTGSEDDPQTLGIISRYALTDLDSEPYYIVEGILKTENEFDTDDDGNRKNSGRGTGGGGWYRITHALGASGVFSKLLTDIITKLIPKITRLLKLFKDPSVFITDIMSELIIKNFEFLSTDAISAFKNADIKNSILSNYAYKDKSNLISPLDGSAIIPLLLFGNDLSFGLSSNMSATKKLPISLIFKKDKPKFNNVQTLIDKLKNNKSYSIKEITENEFNDLKNPIKQLSVKPPKLYEDISIKFEDGKITKLSNNLLDKFIEDNSNKYNFIYITEYLNKELLDIDILLKNGTQQDLDVAKEKLDNLKKNYPDNNILDDKFKELNDKNINLAKNTQPLLKALLGFVTFPLKIIADIIKWMLNFFKSITNPMKLASKMKEFLSFKWIKQFLSPKDILENFGFKFNLGASSGLDLSKFMDVNFISTLPTYAQEQLKYLSNQPLRLMSVIKLMQKIINAVIDFIWSLFGIEALIKSPHINIMPSNIESEIDKKNDEENYEENYTIKDILNNDNNNEIVKNEIEVYEVEMPDGTIRSYFTKEELDIFMLENSNINFDFTN